MHKLLKIGASALSAVVVGFSALPIASAADTGQDVMEDTRYSAVGLGTVDVLVGILGEIAEEVIPDPRPIDEVIINKFAEKAAEMAVNSLDGKSFGTAPNYTPITIEDTFTIMGKRKVMYPNGEYELDTCYVYINKNESLSTPQQFGNFTIAPNTVFIVRQCSWNGDTHGISVPISENNLYLWTYNTTSGFMQFEIKSPPNDTYIYDVASGRESVGFRHGGNTRISFINNNVNTIVRNDLVDEYNNNGSAWYDIYFPDYYMSDFECFLGSGYEYNMGQGFMINPMPWYITTAYFNTDDFESWRMNDYFNTDPNNIDPSKPPAYILPSDNPLAVGNQITNNNISNYNDYGMTVIDGELHIDPDILAGALGGLINPDFNGLLGGVFDAQPQIGLGFDTPLDLNLPDLVGDYLNSITVQPSWDAPQYPAVNTSAFIPATYPTYSTVTIPQDMAQDMGKILTSGWDIFDSLGLLSFVVPIIIMLLLWRFTGK